MFLIDEWHDWWRVFILVHCLIAIGILVFRFARHRAKWNAKTRDYWYSLVMWALSGAVLSVEGILKDNGDLLVRLVFVTAAILVTLQGLRRRGSWGENNE